MFPVVGHMLIIVYLGLSMVVVEFVYSIVVAVTSSVLAGEIPILNLLVYFLYHSSCLYLGGSGQLSALTVGLSLPVLLSISDLSDGVAAALAVLGFDLSVSFGGKSYFSICRKAILSLSNPLMVSYLWPLMSLDVVLSIASSGAFFQPHVAQPVQVLVFSLLCLLNDNSQLVISSPSLWRAL